MIFSRAISFRAYSGEEQPKEKTKEVYFEKNIEKQRDAPVEEQLDESTDGEGEYIQRV